MKKLKNLCLAMVFASGVLPSIAFAQPDKTVCDNWKIWCDEEGDVYACQQLITWDCWQYND